MILPDKIYRILKWLCIVFFPALETLLATLSHIYSWSWGGVVVATIAAIGLFIGALIGVSNAQYYREKSNENTPENNTP